MPLTNNQLLLAKCENVFDSPAQYAVMRLIVDSEHSGRGYAFPSRRKMARLIGRDRRYVLRVIDQLEEREFIQRIGVDREEGPRNRYVVTLQNALARARREAAVPADWPLSRLPQRSVVMKRLRDVGDPGAPLVAAAAFGIGGESSGGGGSLRPPHGDPYAPREGIPVPPQIFPRSSLDLSDGGATAHAAATSTGDQKLPGLLGDQSTPEVHRAAKQARERRRRSLYHKVAARAREILHADPAMGAALNNGTPIETVEDLVFATKALCARRRYVGFEFEVHGACASEWFKGRVPRHAGSRRES
jgi:hypothetical protein